MNQKLILALCCLVGIVLIAWAYWAESKTLAQKEPFSIMLTKSQFPQPPPSVVTPAPTPRNAATNTPVDMNAAREAEKAREISLWRMAIATSITFYGKVIDEKKKPISEAEVRLSPADRIWQGGEQYERTTDAKGLFSISGIHGMGLNVIVSKEGYYALPQSRGNFAYISQVEGLPPHTDPDDPAIFVLRKMGDTEPLITHTENVKLDRIGTPVFMDLSTGRTYGLSNPDIQVQSWVQDQSLPPGSIAHYDWRCKITVPNGGIQHRTGDEFNFIAPTDGYQSNDEIDMSATDPKWMDSQSREYYVQLASGEYARIRFTMAAGGDHFFSITSYLNPTPGHTNLEYDPNKMVSK